MGIHRVLLAASVAAAVASAASADVTFALTHFHACGLELKEFTQPGDISGIITGVTVNVWMEHATAYTYADDLSIYLDTGDLSHGGQLAIGGMNTMQAVDFYRWPVENRQPLRDITFATPLSLGSAPMKLWIGNGFGTQATSGIWNGTITFHGASGIPAPGSLALLGLAGIVGRRRRR